MKISIITVSYNSAQTLKDTIDSVLNQKDCEMEYIIIDGASNDHTINIVEAYFDKISKFTSEPDKGIYHAMNKGLSLATGNIIGFLNADDVYDNNLVLNLVSKEFEEKKCDAVYGDLYYVERENLNRIIRKWKSGSFDKKQFKFGWMPPHPTFFAKKEVFEKFGFFNTDFKSAADYELMLRLIYKHEISLSYIPSVLVKMRIGGISNASLKNRIRANREDRLAWKINDLKPNLLTLWLKPLRKIFQFIR